MARVIGIDLGTTYSAVAVLDGGKPRILADQNGRRTLPSIVSFLPGSVMVGEAAREKEYLEPARTVKRIKRRMGSDWKFEVDNKTYTPEEISSFILRALKEQAERELGTKVKDAIVTVPAYFNDNQRQATKNAGQLAGLNVLRIINEPTAASLAYGVKDTDDLNLVVYDLGGGTLDVSVLNVSDGVFEVISTAGDNHLGGEDFNQRLADAVTARFQDETGIDLNVDPLAMVKVFEAVEKAKIELSILESTRIEVPFVTADESGPRNIDFEITREELERMIGDYVERSLELCRQALNDAKLGKEAVDRVIMVGGSSRIPLVRRKVAEFFGRETDHSLHPDEVVAMGAAIQGGIVQGEVSGIVLVDVTPMSLGIEVEDGYFVPVIERNSPIPTAAKRVFTTVADGQKSVDVQVFQGESMYVKNNVSLGRFRLEGIRSASKGAPRIEVTFELDVNGILAVSAQDMDTGAAQSITIRNDFRLTPEDLARLEQKHASSFGDEIGKRERLTRVLKSKTRAESIASRIESAVPPAYREALVKNELSELLADIDASVKELDEEKAERAIGRLEFIHSELAAGSLRFGEMIA
jgi:molecular chaperone DnaK